MQLFRYLRLALFSSVFVLTGFWLIYNQINKKNDIVVQDKPGQGNAKIGAPFELVDQHKKVRKSEEFQGKFMLVYFGYSFCPDICPMGLQNISEALNRLERDRDEVVPIFITIDPERDTPQNLNLYASNFHPSFIMLTGSSQQLDPLLKSFKVYAAKATPDGTMADYLMDHSTMIYLMGRDGQFIEFFPHSTEPQKIAAILQKHLIRELRGG